MLVASAHAAPCPTGANLSLTSTTCQLSGVHTFGTITLTNSTIEVAPFDGTDKIATGNLELRANTITIDATSKITARGSGYRTLLCGNGTGPNGTAGGRGGCSVRDSGGGGAHFGGGGRGTIDNPPSFPRGYEEDCSRPPSPPTGGLGVVVTYQGSVARCELPTNPGVRAPGGTTCRGGSDGAPTVAGQLFVHSIYQPEFGGSGGDKGCLDGDGFNPGDAAGVMVGGSGGGRIVLAAVNAGKTGQITIAGTLDANGKRGCGIGNDSGGGGAGGTVLVAGDHVTIAATAVVSAAGGLGGDTQGLSSDPTGECAAPFQQNTTADDCGGGGGGGIVSVLSGISADINDRAVFSVAGAVGGVSSICRGEAGGGVGELQISGGYVGEVCDSYDNDFDGVADDNLPTIDCGMTSQQSCIAGVPQQCPADVPACQAPVTDSRTRFTVILDTSGSMLLDLAGFPTFGDGSLDHPGLDHNANAAPDDSRLFKAKTALTNVISAYPNIDFALARYHQDQSLDRSCQNAHNFECNAICCSYDNPTNNSGPAPTPACSVVGTSPPTRNQAVRKDTPGDECINYAGSCGPPRRGADVLVGFGADVNNHLMWLDGTELGFDPADAPGAYCDFAGGGDCELRGSGPTPLANSLQAVEDYLTPIKACDLASTGGCRKYGVILLTDGAESCQGDPVAAAAQLRLKGINTYVIGFSTQPAEAAQLDAIALAGGTTTAFLVGSDDALANTLASIVSSSIVFETCNDLDDDCDTRIDEDFPQKGAACDNGLLGACRGTGSLGCAINGAGLTCNYSLTGGTPTTEACNSIDDDCDGKVDENLGSCACIPTTEVCDGDDDDCDGQVDEGTSVPCGTGTCQGTRACVGGALQACSAPTPGTEVCNGIDDNCDGNADGFIQACSNLNNGFTPALNPLNNPGAVGHTPATGCETLGAQCICRPGSRTCPLNGAGTFTACTGEITPRLEICNNLDDDCDGMVDEAPPVPCTTDAQCATTPLTPTCTNPGGVAGAGTCGPADCSSNCGVGQLICVNGTQQCDAVASPSDDTCNGGDDDCDNSIDEDWVCADPDGADNIPGNADDCPCAAQGQCGAVESCQNGAVVCQGQPIAAESCNCLDDNCNGAVDEGNLCGPGATCTDCQCAFECTPGEFPCPAGKQCVSGYCLVDPCFGVTCPAVPGDLQQCRTSATNQAAYECVSACATQQCGAPNICFLPTGECRPDDCSTFPDRCTADQNCINGACVLDLCKDVGCGTGENCVAGACSGSCASVECPAGERCRLGACQADPCGAPCPFGQACQDDTGNCASDPCATVQCPTGQWCNPNNRGVCEDDPCVIYDVRCATGEVCKGGTCFDVQMFLPDAGVDVFVTTGGGGGCAAGGEGSGLALAGLGLIGLVRRRRAGGAS